MRFFLVPVVLLNKWDPAGWSLLATDCPYLPWQLSCRDLEAIVINPLWCWGLLNDLGQVMSSWFVWESWAYPAGERCKAGYGRGAKRRREIWLKNGGVWVGGWRAWEEGAKLKISQTERLLSLRQEIDNDKKHGCFSSQICCLLSPAVGSSQLLAFLMHCQKVSEKMCPRFLKSHYLHYCYYF